MLGGARLAASTGWLLAAAGCSVLLRRTEMDMEQGKRLAGLILAVTLLQGTMAHVKEVKVDDNREDGSVILICVTDETKITWFKDMEEIDSGNNNKLTWNLGSSTKDPRGIYECKGSSNESKSLQIYYRMCQNCIELNPATVAGFIFTEIVSIFLLAVGVYFIAGQEGVRQSRASDKQTLLNNDQLYQPLKEREDDQYSHLRKK